MALALRDKAVCELSRACGTAGILDGKPNHRGPVDSLYRLGTGLSITGSNAEQPAISRKFEQFARFETDFGGLTALIVLDTVISSFAKH
jgi:hypothetical protein